MLSKGCTIHAFRDCERLLKHVPLMLIETFWASPEEFEKKHIMCSVIIVYEMKSLSNDLCNDNTSLTVISVLQPRVYY